MQPDNRQKHIFFFQRKKATEVFAPSIAASLAGIICSSQNREFQSSALNLLNLERLSVSVSTPFFLSLDFNAYYKYLVAINKHRG